jgi:predicted lipoprotein with Yx(FWY)xxD motif
MKKKIVLPTLLVLVLVASACASAAPAATVVAAPTIMPSVDTLTPAIPVSGGTTAASLMVGQNATLGSFLVDSKGMTLYLYTADQQGAANSSAVSNCYNACASYWPPLLTNGTPSFAPGITAAGLNATLLGTIQRTDGKMQVTYNGWPLYYYSGDAAAGDTTGEGSQGTWFVLTPDGMQK